MNQNNTRIQIYRGNLVTAPAMGELTCISHGYIVVKEGVIKEICQVLPETYEGVPVKDFGDGIIIPAFSDLHIHASQFTERGTGMDCLLFDWLNNYTFPQESGLASLDYAGKIYPQAIRELLRHGTMHASFFTTIHYDACDLFFKMLQESGMYAFTGKVNMDMNSPEFLIEDTQKSIRETDRFIAEHNSDSHVKPILTPRFAPTCSEDLLKGLAEIGQRRHVGMQTHLVESLAEAASAKELFPQFRTDGDIYEQLGLLENGPSIFAHVIFPEEIDREILRKHQCMCVHCPDSTTNITAGIMPVSDLTEEGIGISLGCDIGAGQAAGIYRQVGRAVQMSKLKEFYEPGYKRITFADAFYLATTAGGSVFGNVGQLKEGYQFNALVVDGLEDIGASHTVPELLERFCYAGDDRNIVHRYLDGIEIDPEEVYQRLTKVEIK